MMEISRADKLRMGTEQETGPGGRLRWQDRRVKSNSQTPERQILLVDLAGHQGRPTDDLTAQPYHFPFMFNSNSHVLHTLHCLKQICVFLCICFLSAFCASVLPLYLTCDSLRHTSTLADWKSHRAHTCMCKVFALRHFKVCLSGRLSAVAVCCWCVTCCRIFLLTSTWPSPRSLM